MNGRGLGEHESVKSKSDMSLEPIIAQLTEVKNKSDWSLESIIAQLVKRTTEDRKALFALRFFQKLVAA